MSQVTFCPVVYAQYRRKDGNYAVKMRITHNSKSKFITTSERATPAQLTRSLAIKDPALKQRLERLVLKMREALSDLDMYELMDMTVDEVAAHIQKRNAGEFQLDFLAFWPEAVADKANGSKNNYMYALKSFKRFLGTESLDIKKVTSRLMHEYEDWLNDEYGKGARAVSMYTAAVRHVHSLARKRYNDDERGEINIRNPFEFYKPPKPSMRATRRDVSPSVIQQMIDLRDEMQGVERRTIDAFLLSFAFMGMNAPDLLGCRPPKKDVIVYNRQKTRTQRQDKAEMHVRIEPCITKIYSEWAERDGTHAFKFHRFHANYRQFNWTLAHGIKAFKKRIGFPEDERLDFYSARHTWATLAYSIGINEGVINDCLCHINQDMKVTDIYIRKDWSVMWEANAKVLAQFRWPD